MGNADDRDINLAEHNEEKLNNTPENILDGEIFDVKEKVSELVKSSDKPEGDWIPFSSLIKTIMAGRMSPDKMTDELEKLRERNRQNNQEINLDKAA